MSSLDNKKQSLYLIYSDGGSRGNPGIAAAAFLVVRNNEVICSQSRYLGKTTNNLAEYTGVLMALSWLEKKTLGQKDKITFFLDSELVVNQLKGRYKIKSENLKPIIAKIKKKEAKIKSKIEYLSIPRSRNKLADHLVNKVLDGVSKKETA